MKHLFWKISLASLLLAGFLPTAFSQAAQVTQTEKAPTSQGAKEETKAKESSSSAAAQENKTPENVTKASSQSGWFVGIRGAYVPAYIGEIGYQFNQTFKLRILGIGGHYFRTLSIDNQTYNHIRFQNFKLGLMADWHPWKNGIRLTAGIAYNGNTVRLEHAVTGTLLGQPASLYGTIMARYKYYAIVPYLGIGYDTGSLGASGISISADAGFWIQGKARSSFSFTGTGQNNSTIINNVQAHIANLINKRKLIRNLPMVSLGIRYMF